MTTNDSQYPIVKPSTIFDFRHDLVIYYAKCVVDAKKRMERFPEDRYFVLSYNDYVIRLGYWLGEVTTEVFERMTEYWHNERMVLLDESIKKSEMVGRRIGL